MSDCDNLLDLPLEEARARLATGAPAHLFINPVEYHGPHLPLHNDRLVSQGLARDLHARLAKQHPEWQFFGAGDLEIGVEPTRGVGSRHTSFVVARDLVREACRAVAQLGARKVVLHTFHGAPLHNLAIEGGVELLQSKGVAVVAPFNAIMRELLEVEGSIYAEAFTHIEDRAEADEMMRDLRLDFHGGFFETSMTLHYAPASVAASYVSLPPCPKITPNRTFARAADMARRAGSPSLANELTLAAWGTGWQALDPFPGYTGRPHRATREAGAVFARHILDRFERIVTDVFEGRAKSPTPIMSWSAAVTMNGRLNPTAWEVQTS